MNNLSRMNIKDELILSLSNPCITSAINKYYRQYFNTELEVYNYENEIIDITSSNYLTVRIGVFPFLTFDYKSMKQRFSLQRS